MTCQAQFQSLVWSWLCFLQLQICLLSVAAASFSMLLWLFKLEPLTARSVTSWAFLTCPTLALLPTHLSSYLHTNSFVKLRCYSLKNWRYYLFWCKYSQQMIGREMTRFLSWGLDAAPEFLARTNFPNKLHSQAFSENFVSFWWSVIILWITLIWSLRGLLHEYHS